MQKILRKFKKMTAKKISRHNKQRNKNYSNDNIDKERLYLNYSIKQPRYSYKKEFDLKKKQIL